MCHMFKLSLRFLLLSFGYFGYFRFLCLVLLRVFIFLYLLIAEYEINLILSFLSSFKIYPLKSCAL